MYYNLIQYFSLHKRISILENINKITNNSEYFYKINNF